MKWIMIMMTSILAGCMTTYEMAQEAPIQSFCPDFGRLARSEFPVENDPQRMYVRSYKGGAIIVEKRLGMEADQIKTYSDYEAYLDVYAQVCGKYPHFIESLPFFRVKLNEIQAFDEKRKSLMVDFSKAMGQFPDFEVMRPELRRLKAARSKVAQTEKRMSELGLELFQVAGEIVTIRPDYVQIIGSAVGDKGTIVPNVNIMIHKYRDSDVYYRKMFNGFRYYAISLYTPYVFSTDPGKDAKAIEHTRLVAALESQKAAVKGIIEGLKERCEMIQSTHRLRSAIELQNSNVATLVSRLDYRRNISLLDPFREAVSPAKHAVKLDQCMDDVECKDLIETRCEL